MRLTPYLDSMAIKSTRLVALAIVGSLASCGPRAPTSFPRNSAASDLADEAPAAPIGLALREDPPLPGQSGAGWTGLGLEGSDAGAGGGCGHHHMPGMDMGGMDMGIDGGHDGH